MSSLKRTLRVFAPQPRGASGSRASDARSVAPASPDTAAMASDATSGAPSDGYWRSLRELEGDPEFLESLRYEFQESPEDFAESAGDETGPHSPGRRRFVQLMGASVALASAAAGCTWDSRELLPLAERPEGRIPGNAQFFATTQELAGVALGMHAKSFDGRPVKLEGNPLHPGSLGKAGPRQQAGTLELYDPSRSKAPRQRRDDTHVAETWATFDAFLRAHLDARQAEKSAGLAVLSGASSSPTLADLKRRFLSRYPQALWVEYEPINDDNERAGARLAFGKPLRMQLDLAKAAVIVTLDADLLGEHPNWIPQAQGFAARRDPAAPDMVRLYAFESAYTMTGGMADHRVPLRAELIKALAAALDAEVSSRVQKPELGAAQARPTAAFLAEPAVAAAFNAVVADLVAHQGRSVVCAGAHQPPEVHALAHRLNVLLGNVGTTVAYTQLPAPERAPQVAALAELASAMTAGKVHTLLMLGGNPVYDSPADLDFAGALAKVPTSVHLSLYFDETSRKSTWHLPAAHWLESWGDSLAFDGTISLAQPLIAPLYGGRSVLELLALANGEQSPAGQALVRRTHSALDERLWRRAVHAGLIEGTAFPRENVALQPVAPLAFSARELGSSVEPESLELQLAPAAGPYDGRFANLGWLQEMPDMMTKLTWDNALTLAPATAKKHGLRDRDIVSLAVGGRQLAEVPVMIQPGQAPGTARLALGYGRTAAGAIGGDVAAGVAPVGVDAYKLRTTKLWDFGAGATLAKVGSGYPLATMQDTHSIDAIGQAEIQRRVPRLVREGTHEEYKHHPEFARHMVHSPPLDDMWKSPVSYDGERWGMSVNLGTCIGCNACIVACIAENNVPVAGKARVLRGREMHWLSVHRYFLGDENSPRLAHQPVTCHQCETAPCEQVCPVAATLHSQDGLNDMTYNRCIGTRYCSNNCPYKVRRFNYFNYHEDLKDPANDSKKMGFNPEVTLRFRGVMEKCTFCVQRIRRGKLDAKNEGRELVDFEIQTACQQTCPTGAIVFGDLNLKGSLVAKRQAEPRSYAMLGELNVRPRLEYLAKITNPNPALASHAGGTDDKAHG